MTPSEGANIKKHRNGFRTAGWAAFDREHREKEGIGVVGAVDPSSSISKNTFLGMIESSNIVDSEKSLLSVQSMLTRSFSSVVQPSAVVQFPLLKAHTKNGISNICVDDDQHVVTVKNKLNPAQMLKNVHIWADQYLIEDILEAVNNDVGQASILLKEMASFETEIKSMQNGPGMSSSADVSNQSNDTNIILEKSGSFVDNNIPENSCKKIIIDKFYVPTEPEWEEDDVYLCHRKEALKLMRAASQHSRTASNAYLRGDHLSAQQLSSRAREERMTAEKLNAKAAEEILRTRNINNGVWKLDLHGLHAAEAVHALIQHLQRLESDMTMSHSASPVEMVKPEPIQGSPFDFLDRPKATSYTKGNTVPQQRQTLLHVITGTGNHSKGEASLPVAIKSFLIDEGYRFDEARPGLISVHPKFRYK